MFGLIFRVPNNKEGQQFFKLAKKFLNKHQYKIERRGRHSHRADLAESQGYPRNFYNREMPIKYAESFVAYVYSLDEETDLLSDAALDHAIDFLEKTDRLEELKGEPVKELYY